jgi:hypothetical protein
LHWAGVAWVFSECSVSKGFTLLLQNLKVLFWIHKNPQSGTLKKIKKIILFFSVGVPFPSLNFRISLSLVFATENYTHSQLFSISGGRLFLRRPEDAPCRGGDTTRTVVIVLREVAFLSLFREAPG